MSFDKNSKAVLVIDADAVLSLSKPISDEYLTEEARAEGRTFLDIVKVLSQGDDIEQIVITDGAIWEIMGKIDGHQVDQPITNEGNARNPSFKRLQSFVDEVSAVDANGEVTKEGKYPKICIRQTSSNAEFEEIREKANEYVHAEISKGEFWKFAKTKEVEAGGEVRTEKRRNIGENVSESFMTLEYEGQAEMFFLSGDSHARAVINERCTREGTPIGGMNIMGFIGACLNRSMKAELGIDLNYTKIEVKKDLEAPDSKREQEGEVFKLMGGRDKRGKDERVAFGRNFQEFLHNVDHTSKRKLFNPNASDSTSWVGRAKPQDDDPRRERGPEIFER